MSSGWQPFELQWRPATLASSLHAANCLCRQLPLADVRLASVLRASSDRLVRCLAERGLDPHNFLTHAIPLAGQAHAAPQQTDHDWLALALTACQARDPEPEALSTLRACVEALHADFLREKPHAQQELALRSAPLMEQWEARGLGLMARLTKLTGQRPAPTADVLLVHPVLGGDGAAYPWRQALLFEAMLANPHAPLPEVLRLGWLLAQLPAMELATGGEAALAVPSWSIATLRSLALLPATLAAGEYVELCRNDEPTLVTALAAWRLPPVDPQALAAWWQRSQAEQLPWPAALAELAPCLPAKE